MIDLNPKVETIWAVSVVLQHPETFEMHHAMGQLIDFHEDRPRQFVIKKALEKFPAYTLVSCKTIPIAFDAIKSLGYVRVRNSAPSQAEIDAEKNGLTLAQDHLDGKKNES